MYLDHYTYNGPYVNYICIIKCDGEGEICFTGMQKLSFPIQRGFGLGKREGEKLYIILGSTVQEQWVRCSLLNVHYCIMTCFFIPSGSFLALSLIYSEFELSTCCNFNT